MRMMEEQLAEFQKMQETEQGQKGEKRAVAASGDETWLGDQMLLVLMELSSGYLVMEEAAEDRSYTIPMFVWYDSAEKTLAVKGLDWLGTQRISQIIAKAREK